MIKLSKKSNYLNHRDHLKYCLLKRKNVNTVEQSIQEEIIENKFNNILEKIDAISEEKLERTFIGEKNLFENEKSNKKILEIKNLSTGLKSFMLIKNLIVNGYIEENGTIILDEPEVHLHPEWQILFAEIIVLLQKEYNMHILLATHSPYFLNAIEVYSKKYKILDKCKYYLTEKEKNVFKIFDVSEDTEQIYKKLVKPFKKLESLENEDKNSKIEIRNKIAKEAGEKIVLFELDKFKKLYFKDVLTLNRKEFEDYLEKLEINIKSEEI